MSLAAKLPYDHAYAGGYPGIGSQPLPTDSGCLTYLAAVKAADGAGVETSVAVAVDAFFRDLKATPGLFEAIKASCILAGARTLSGALVPVVGDAPTNVANGFVSGDYSRTAGLTGDGTSYLDSGRAADDDPQNDRHMSVYATSATTNNTAFIGSIDRNATPTSASQIYWRLSPAQFLCTASCETSVGTNDYSGNEAFVGVTRSSGSTQIARLGGNEYEGSNASTVPSSLNSFVFGRNDTDATFDVCDATLAFYSIGTGIGSAGLAALNTAVSNLISAIGEAL